MKDKKNIFIIVFILAIAGAIGTTFAYYKIMHTTGSSVFVASLFDTTFNTEYTSSLCELNGKKDDYDFKVKNASDKAFMTRISLDEKWIDSNGNVVLNNVIAGEELAIVNFANSSDWKKIGNYYYYKNSIEPGEVTQNLIKGFEVTINYDGTNMCHYDLSNEEEVCTEANFECSNYTFKVDIKVDVIETEDYEEVWNVDSQTVKQDSTYTVNFIRNDKNATGSMVSVEYVYGTIYNLPKNAYAKEGYDFVEWNTDYLGRGRSFTDEEQIEDIGNGDIDIVNLYAIWKKPYDVVFVSNDSVNCPLDSTTYAKIENVKYGDLIKETAIPNPECTGYIFEGWLAEGDIDRNTAKYGIVNTPENLWTAGNKGTYFKNLSTTGGEVELVADWEEKSYLIHFNGNGVTGGSTESVECKYSEQCVLTKNGYERTGSLFKGWSTTPKGSVVYTDEQTVNKLTLNDEITLYAIWEIDSTFCQNNYDVEVASGIVCKRAVNLHKVSCASTQSQGCALLPATSSEITYGNCGTKENVYTSGDAFDCDVNGDGEYNERFYYLSDYYNPNTGTWDNNTAVFVYYTSVQKVDGEILPDVNVGSKYAASNDNKIGPSKGEGYAMSQLPTTSDWSNLALVNTSRQIRNTSNSVYGNVIDYTGFASRFLTYQELVAACGSGTTTDAGYLDSCNYIMENTRYQNSTYLGGIWFETASGTEKQVVRTLGGSRKTGVSTVTNSGAEFGSTRPVIEVPKTKVLTKLNDIADNYTITFNGNGATEGVMDVLTCDTFDNCTLTNNKYVKDGYAFVGWSTVPNGTIKYENGEEVYNLVLSGNINLYAVWDDSLYGVVKEGYDKVKVDKYIGVGHENYDNDVYFYNGSSDVNNVIYGGYCWKIIRTTKTGGVKLVYNGEVENGRCLSTRSNKTGIKGLNAEEVDLNGNYLYGTKFIIDGTSIRVSGNTNTGTYTTGTSSTYQGLYTCLNLSGICDKVYRVGTNSNGTIVYAAPYEIGTIGYNEIATSAFNSNYKSVSSVGYMYNTSYNYKDSGNCYYESSGEKRCLDVQSLPDALNTMLKDNNVNTYDSDVKRLVDLWYEENMQDYTSGIEDTIFCNEREPYNTTTIDVLNKSGWHGGTLGQPLYFTTSITAKSFDSLYCENDVDKFSVTSEVGNAKLSYPVGLISASEYFISNATSQSSINNSMNGLHLISANSVTNNINNNYVNSRGVLSYYGSTGDARGIRPSISLKPGTKFQTGTGYEFDPFVVILSDNGKTTLVIDLDGGVSSQSTQISANSGEEITLVEPTKEDYIFLNWTVEKGTPSAFTGNKITLNLENVVVKAKWKPIYDNKYSVNFTSSDNTVCPLDSTIYASLSNISYGELIKTSAIANPDCAGYRFTGWTATGDINTTTAKYGNINTPNKLWQDKNKGTYFKDLSTTDNGTVTLTANFIDATLCPDNENIVVVSGAKCKRATTLSKSGDEVYGSCGTLGELSQGDAFDCDLDDDGTFESRYYYESDYYNSKTNTTDVNTATLVTYNGNNSINVSKSKIMIGNKYPLGDVYTVSFEVNGGTIDTNSKTVTNGSVYGTLPLPTKTSNVFDGWYLDVNLTYKVEENSVVDLNEDTTLYAKYSNSYVIKFESSGASGKMNDLTCYVDIDCPLTANAYVSSYDNFVGWATSKNGPKVYDNEQVVKNIATNDEITLYAVWNMRPNSNVCTNNESIMIASGAKCKRASSLHYTEHYSTAISTTMAYGQCGVKGDVLSVGDAFDCDVNGDGVFDGATERFYYMGGLYDSYTKKWNDNVATLIYYSNVDTTGVPTNNKTYTYGSVKGPIYAVNALPTSGSNGIWSNISLVNPVRQILTIQNSTSVNYSEAELPVGFSYSTYAARLLSYNELANACSINSATYKISNCDFLTEINKDWWLETVKDIYSDMTVNAIRFSSMNIKDSSMLASYGVRPVIEVVKSEIMLGNKYALNDVYTVTFDANGGALSTNTKDVTNGSSFGILPTPTKSGYVFDGWYSDSELTNEITENSVVDLNGNIILYAKWTNTYTIVFNSNGGQGTTASVTCTLDTDCKLTKNGFKANIYTNTSSKFAGWSTTIDGNKEYDDEQIVRNIAQKGIVSLYAVWQK